MPVNLVLGGGGRGMETLKEDGLYIGLLFSSKPINEEVSK